MHNRKTTGMIVLFLLATAMGGCVNTQSSPPLSSVHGAELFPGIGYESHKIAAPIPAQVHIVEMILNRPGIRFTVTPADRSKNMEHTARLTTAYMAEKHAQLAINASYFLPFKGGSKGGEDYYPHVGDPVNISGAAIAAGKIVSPVETDIDERVDSMLCFDKSQARIVDGQHCPKGYSDGVAVGPRLLKDGKAIPSSQKYSVEAHPRTAFGISADHKRAWIITVDGRQPDSKGMSLADLSDLFLQLGASDATNLDGGGSTTLAVEGTDGKPHILNNTIHTGVVGRERPVANHILVYAPHKTNKQ